MSRTILDETDRRILDLLLHDARRSASDVGRHVHLSPAAAKRRIDRLEDLGVISGYRAVINHAKLGSNIEAFVEVRFKSSTQVDDMAAVYVSLPELIEGFTIAGDPDALVRLRVNDLGHLKRVIDTLRRSGLVASTKTLIVLGSNAG
jgi:Lrp/AsnC family leucine-responsive transcriptional regulator